MLLWIVLIALAYCVIGSLTGGYIHQVKKRGYGSWGNDDSWFVGAGWPISFFWYAVLKPISRAGNYLAEAQEKRVERLKKIREQLEAVERERQLEIQKHIRELEAEQAEYEARQQQASA